MSTVILPIDPDDELSDDEWFDRMACRIQCDAWRAAALEAEDHAMRIASGEWPLASAVEALKGFAAVARVQARDWAKSAEGGCDASDDDECGAVIN